MSWGDVAVTIGGVLLGILGWALVADYRGATSWHARTTVELSQPVPGLAPRRWLPQRATDPERGFARLLRHERWFGWVLMGIAGFTVVRELIHFLKV